MATPASIPASGSSRRRRTPGRSWAADGATATPASIPASVLHMWMLGGDDCTVRSSVLRRIHDGWCGLGRAGVWVYGEQVMWVCFYSWPVERGTETGSGGPGRELTGRRDAWLRNLMHGVASPPAAIAWEDGKAGRYAGASVNDATRRFGKRRWKRWRWA